MGHGYEEWLVLDGDGGWLVDGWLAMVHSHGFNGGSTTKLAMGNPPDECLKSL